MITFDSSKIKYCYNELVNKCKKTNEPVYLLNNGQKELVAMDVYSFNRREQQLNAQQLVLEAYASRLSGEKDYSQKEAMSIIDKMISKPK